MTGKHRHSISEETVAWYPSLSGTYNYILDGTGVDVVIQDSGIQSTSQSSMTQMVLIVKQIDWYTASGLAHGTQNVNLL